MSAEAKQIFSEILQTTETGSDWGFGHQATIAKICAHPERLALFLAGLETEITPVNMEVWPSLTCNARCALCPYIRNLARHEADRHTADPFFMSLELFAKLAREFRQAGGLSVNLTGGGEPTLHPHCTDFGRIACNNGLSWGLFSNGYGLEPRLIDGLLEQSPEWIRVSINSWSPASHNQTYHLGPEAYERVQRNLIYLSRHAPNSIMVGIGYIMDHVTPAELRGMKAFIEAVHQASGRLDYVAIRPAMLYYAKGIPLACQPDAERFRPIPELCREILGTICENLGIILHINDSGFRAIADRKPPAGCGATSWATSATEAGKLYLLSEANGSRDPQLEELAYGNVSGRTTFLEAWQAEHRRRLTKEFASGIRLAPVLHKLSGLDEALRTLRNKFGIVQPEVAQRVADALAQRPKPKHWMFI